MHLYKTYLNLIKKLKFVTLKLLCFIQFDDYSLNV